MVKKIKKELQTTRGKFILLIGCIIFLLIGWTAFGTSVSAAKGNNKIREITLEIKDMAFASNNPTIYLNPNETVRFNIYNLDPGVKHNFAIKETGIETPILKYQEQASVVFNVPNEGQWIYQCNPHASMMNGRLEVQ